MVWFTVGSGVLMTAAGFGFLVLGFDIVMTERGSAMTIGGTIALCSGLATIALGLATRRLTQILRALEDIGRDARAPWSAAAPEPAPPGGPEAQSLATGAAAAAAAGAATVLGPGLALQADPAEAQTAEVLPDRPEFDLGGTADPAPTVLEDALDDICNAPLTDPASLNEAAVGTAAVASAELGPAAGGKPGPLVAPGPADAPESDLPAEETPLDDHPRLDPGEDAPLVPPAHAGSGEPDMQPGAKIPGLLEERPAPASARPTLLGTYRAGGRTYTMYSDGTVEAVTADGVERFESMQALRKYLAKT